MPVPAITAESDATELRTALREAGASLGELRSRTADQRGDTWNDDVREHIDFINHADAMLTAAERGAEPTPQVRGPYAAFERGEGRITTAGNVLTDAEEYRDAAKAGRLNGFEMTVPLLNGPDGDLRSASGEVRALLLSENSDPGAGVFRPVGTPTMRAGTERRMRMFVRDLISVQPTGLASVPYIRERNAATNEGGAAMTSEGSAKAEVTMQFEQADAPIRKITAWIPVTTEILADAPTLRGYIDNRLTYMILLREEAQVLAGNGTAPNISGILDNSPQTQAAVAGDVPATIAAAFGKIENVDGEADGVVFNPLDFWGAIGTRHSAQFDNGFGGNQPASVELSSLTWGERVVRSRALSQGRAIAGAWFLGATLHVREGVNIVLGNQHEDYLTHNKVAIVGEERVGLAIHRPDWFVDVTIDLTA